ncbi:hypothetical protein HN51_014299 [Arachis hypogaea]|uniref:Uncharacterized protein n=1 Tax=Arachis hypogaea TaxID=3818 RepID=A0A445CPU4_ARAHY|nr:uncharacterized protein LOC112695148 [Arachis hypogaea]XP_025603158.1 uncharacterized protein LOC112695148 [Arachis hypogaea]XP_025603159.1 uncharacterized protein LOC112695148 [Arachis hypogaea]QHO45777.1 uncharacterized protein DS421_6g181780 [Arachis hypogaea]QHO45778.1 uncharacterized protein DS421_6g181780 [Arachis hypogaea]QHO45779.1 uncharacterized protein DS421_6g181780 [Arachis hypogaea]RYR52962.1 hypothetical protein Ahy_A06g027810 [Arachis hypogaea]
MEGSPLVLDISSDEEPCLEESDAKKRIDYDDMIKEWLVMPDEEPEQDHVVVNELGHKSNSKSKSRSSASAPSMKDMQDHNDDDDCVILDGDPERAVTTSVEEITTAASDELVVVGEKGQVACRDYPHPRHLCANFPFSSTPHEQHCEQCYCYICDCLSPCPNWGTGLSSADHCHATAGSGMWETLRKNFKLGKIAPIPASTNYVTSCEAVNDIHNLELRLDAPRCSPVSPLLNQSWNPMDIPQFSPVSPLLNQSWNPMVSLEPQNQASNTIIAWSSSLQKFRSLNQVSMPITIPLRPTTNAALQHGANHARSPESAFPFARSGYQSHSVPRQVLGVRNHTIQRGQVHGAVCLSPQFLHSHMIARGVNSARSIPTTNYTSHGDSFGLSSQVGSAQAQQYGRYHHATGISNNGTPYVQSDAIVPNTVGYPQLIPGKTSLNFIDVNRNQHLNEHQFVNQNGPAQAKIVTCGMSMQDACLQLGESQNRIECAGNEERSINQPPNIKNSGTEFTQSRNLGSIDDIKNLLFNEDESFPEDGALPSDLNITSYLESN